MQMARTASIKEERRPDQAAREQHVARPGGLGRSSPASSSH